uniref:Uncharacterized protein n=1 Tax=Arundo donax TaxID=35708 RepID=A0A0A9AP65_ARUDO
MVYGCFSNFQICNVTAQSASACSYLLSVEDHVGENAGRPLSLHPFVVRLDFRSVWGGPEGGGWDEAETGPDVAEEAENWGVRWNLLSWVGR